MDNLYEYIIALVFIVSILSEIFGKKKKKKETSEPNETRNYEKESPVVIERTFEEIFGVKPPIPKQENANYQYRQSESEKNNREQKYNYDSNSYSKPELTSQKESFSQKYGNSLEIEKQTISYMPNQNTGYSKEEMKDFTDSIDHLKNSLFNYNSLRDYIVATEILNKPISLRRRCQRN